ncbi:unnamed protein product, partial [Rotaria sordida]
MRPFNQDTIQTETYKSPSKQSESTSETARGSKQNIHNGHGRKRRRKHSRTTSSTSSKSLYKKKHYPAGSRSHKHGGIAAGAGNYIYDERQQCSANDVVDDPYGGLGGYNEFYYGNEAVGDESSDIYRRRRRHHHGYIRHQTVRLPDQPGVVRQVRHRMPTPEPDILERVYVRRQLTDIIEEI